MTLLRSTQTDLRTLTTSIHPLAALSTTQDHILVVDDQPSSCRYISQLLQAAGYSVTVATSGQDALHLMQTLQPDLILLDVLMPDLSGFQVCQQLKGNELTRLMPIVLITSLRDRGSLLQGIEAGADDFIPKPFDPVELLARVRSLIYQKHLNEDLDHAAQVLFAIARSIESRDPTTGDHCERLEHLGKAFALHLGLSRQEIKALQWGAYLHDIGKVGIPDAVLGKRTRHTPEEWEVMKSHVLIGESICKGLRTMQDVLPIIRHHHERWDGSGYPDQLVGEAIPLLARIFQVIDIFDALTSERPYKQAYTPETALQILAQETENGWRDPQVVQEFSHFIRLHPSLCAQAEISHGSEVVVVS